MYFTTLLLLSAVLLMHSASLLESPSNICRPSPQCDPQEENDCSKCYDLLANELVISDRNRFNLQQAFFPPNDSNPAFVAVTYHFIRNATGPTNYSMAADGPKQVWFWTQSTFYLFQPIESLHFTSLLLSDRIQSSKKVSLYLQPSCEESSTDMMRLLTQRVSLLYLMHNIELFNYIHTHYS